MPPSQIYEIRPGHRTTAPSDALPLEAAQTIAEREANTMVFQLGVGAFLVAQVLPQRDLIRPVPDTLKRHWIVTS